MRSFVIKPFALTAQILGIGIDLIEIQRIRRLFLQCGSTFTHRVFTEKERIYANRFQDPSAAYAKRFAAKEAFSKAVGCGIGQLLSWRDIEVLHTPERKPFIHLQDNVYARLCTYLHQSFRIHLALTDQAVYGQAFVILEAEPQAISSV